jgi:hypothetical protein
MAQGTEHVTRKLLHLCVPVYPDEAQEIRRNATSTGKLVAAYLRAAGMGYRILTALDQRRIDDLLRVNGDLGRLAKIKDTQAELLAVIRSVAPPRTTH